MGIELDLDKVQRGVVEEIADRILEEDRLRDTVNREINARIDKLFAERAEAQVSAAIEQAVTDAFDREYRPVDGFGRPAGEATSIRKRLEELSDRYWRQRVDKNGKPTDSTYSSSMTRAEYVMMQACGEDFAKHIKQEAVNVSAALKDGLRKEMREWIDRSLGDLFKVRSKMDQDEGRRT